MKAIWSTRCFGGLFGLAAANLACVIFLWIGAVKAAEAQATPHIFFSDITSGPAVGGEAGAGSFVTIYGAFFGSGQNGSYITIGGGRATSYPVWSENKVAFQLGRDARSGPIVMHVDGRPDSNAIPFRVRAGRITFFPSHNGDSLQSTIDRLSAGDILYLRDGVRHTSLDRYDASLNVMHSGNADDPIAVVAYPGAAATVGSFDGPLIAARTPNVHRTSDHWVLAGLQFRGNQEALDLTDSKDWRIVGNDFTCPNGFGPTGCVEISQASEIAFLGNTIHDVGRQGTSKVYHGLYFSTDSNHIDVGWNTVSRVRGCRGIQFHSTPEGPGTGLNQYDIHIHDNVIHDTVCDGINLATINPSAGVVEVYNNLIYNVGEGPDPPDGSANYSCIYVQGGANRGPAGSGVVEIDHNTMYRCGGRRNTDSGALSLSPGSPQQQVRLRNNVIVLDHGVSLLSPRSTKGLLVAQANVVWWLDAKQSSDALQEGFFLAHPVFRDTTHADFRPADHSPTLQRGVVSGREWTLDGRHRDAGKRPDVGAY